MAYEAISVFDIFKIGVGPSSSHTLGPWVAIEMWLKELKEQDTLESTISVRITLYGSLALTGRGHCTDVAICLALMGHKPETIDTGKIQEYIQELRKNRLLQLSESNAIIFNPETDIVFENGKFLEYHPNAMRFEAICRQSNYQSVFYSIGGGFVEKEGERKKKPKVLLPFPATYPRELLNHCRTNGSSIAGIVFENESSILSPDKVNKKVLKIWSEMKECAFRGCHTGGILPGGLNVKRHAKELNASLLRCDNYSNSDEWINYIRNNTYTFNETLRWISCFALAVNEENASLGRIVTAPTNGAAGVIPAVLLYFICFSDMKITETEIINFLLTAGEVGTFFKKKATISAAMGGCQAEIGVSSSMAAAALCEIRGGTPEQAFIAAEIAMEHHLGMTCDPVRGLVQIPCIERNAMGAIKAINAAELALEKTPVDAKVTLDKIIETMWDTAVNMNEKYKETSKGGLAVTVDVPEC